MSSAQKTGLRASFRESTGRFPKTLTEAAIYFGL